MSDIAYLLGAGASANSIKPYNPAKSILKYSDQKNINGNDIASKFQSGFLEFVDYLKNQDKLFLGYSAPEQLNYSELHETLEPLVKYYFEESSKHYTVDTFAKKLSYQGGLNLEELKELKNILGLLFIFLQYGFKLDYRYDAFLAGLLNIGKGIRPINVFSWNYDIQFEMAHYRLTCKQFFEDSLNFNVVQRNTPILYNPQTFNLFKLNGTAGFKCPDNSIFPPIDVLESIERSKIIILLNIYNRIKLSQIESLLSYAWENDEYSTIEKAASAFEGIKYLVVIGYSFPLFNREIDRKLFNRISRIRKIYVQDTEPDRIIKRINAIRRFPSTIFVPVNDVDQFHIPDEF